MVAVSWLVDESFMTNLPIEVQKYLRGVDYPATKDELVRRAEEEGADENVRRALQSLPRERFDSPNDVSEALGGMR